MSRGDDIIHQQTRLQIMATLCALRQGESIEFTRLKAIVQATDGNLGAHIATLEGAGYIDVIKDFIGKRPRTRVALTRNGRGAFARHVDYLRAILDAPAAFGPEKGGRS
jgi:DNA-binding MarR family transcriptional regulator